MRRSRYDNRTENRSSGEGSPPEDRPVFHQRQDKRKARTGGRICVRCGILRRDAFTEGQRRPSQNGIRPRKGHDRCDEHSVQGQDRAYSQCLMH